MPRTASDADADAGASAKEGGTKEELSEEALAAQVAAAVSRAVGSGRVLCVLDDVWDGAHAVALGTPEP